MLGSGALASGILDVDGAASEIRKWESGWVAKVGKWKIPAPRFNAGCAPRGNYASFNRDLGSWPALGCPIQPDGLGSRGLLWGPANFDFQHWERAGHAQPGFVMHSRNALP